MATLNLAGILDNAAVEYADREAIVLPNLQDPGADVRLTYTAVNALANQVANALVANGIKPGDKVALSCPNTPYFTFIYFGILKAGATVVPLNVLLKHREVEYHLTDSDAKAYFCFEGTPDLPMSKEGYAGFEGAPDCTQFIVITATPGNASPIEGVPTLFDYIGGQPNTFETVATDEDDTAVILYTSGTTGKPKGAELRHRNMYWTAQITADSMGEVAEEKGFDTDEQTSVLLVLPLFHSFGQTCVQNAGFIEGANLVLMSRFEPYGALQIFLREKIRGFAGVPTMFWAMLAELDKHPEIDPLEIAQTLQGVSSGGSALPVEIHHEWEKHFGVTIGEGYGLSETAPTATRTPAGQMKAGSVGTPLDGVAVKLVKPGTFDEIDEMGEDAIGEIAIKGPNVMKGYYKRPEATAEVLNADGWFRTGDLGRQDEDGWFYIVDRAKDMILRGGFNVYPREIEEVLMTHPAVSLAAVIGVPDERHGEEVKAFVIKNPGFDDVTEEDLVAWSKDEMAGYKYPRIVEFAKELPMTSTGKILKRELS